MKNLKENALYVGAMLLGVGALLCTSGVENAENGWVMLGWTGVALALGAVALVLAGLGIVAGRQPPKKQPGKKVHQPQKNTVKAGRCGRKAG